jgi:hypothetical protein
MQLPPGGATVITGIEVLVNQVRPMVLNPVLERLQLSCGHIWQWPLVSMLGCLFVACSCLSVLWLRWLRTQHSLQAAVQLSIGVEQPGS